MEDKQNKENDSSGIKKVITRRDFFNYIGTGATGLVALGFLGVTLEYLSPNVLLEIPKEFKIGPIESIQPDSVTYNPDHSLYIFREKQGGFYALSAICTHLGCRTKWNPAGIKGHPEGVIACPCHGSVFDNKGNVLHGPAPRHLDRYLVKVEDDKLDINTGVTVSEDEMVAKV
jgi:cytochrome b6-f complex iron-sulfur subunit